MKQRLYILFLAIAPLFGFAQPDPFVVTDSAFKTVFANTRAGNFPGTVSGLLIVKTGDGQTILIEVQGAEASLQITPSDDDVYDISTFSHSGESTRGAVSFRYETYWKANIFELDLHGKTYGIGVFDRVSDRVIAGLAYQYQAEADREYLSLQFQSPIELDTYWWLRSKTGTSPEEIQQAREETERISILPGSVLLFVMER
jgi:hypothetical protein